MKKIFFILVLFTLQVNLHSEQYYWMQTYTPKYAVLDDISSNAQSEVYVLGHRTNSIVLFKSDTLGKDWKLIKDDWPTDQRPGYVPPISFRVCTPYKNYVYIGMEGFKILKSRNGGINYDTVKLEPIKPEYNKSPMNFIRGLSMADTNVGIASTGQCLYITKDGWKTYEAHSTLGLDIPNDFYIAFGDNFSNNVYAFDKDNFISNIRIGKEVKPYEYIMTTGTVRTTDGGKTWHLAILSYLKEQNEPKNFIVSFYFHDKNNGWGVGYRNNEWDSTGAREKSVIFKTTDGGLSWENNFEITAGKVGAIFLRIAFRDYNRGVVVGKYGSQFYTTDGGNTWVDESRTDLQTKSNRTVQQVTFSGKFAVISTIYDGIYTAMSYHKTSDIFEDNTSLDGHIYPNPARDFITIDLREYFMYGIVEQLPQVQIFDLLGLEVMNVELQSWENTQNIDISKLPSGSYYLRIGKNTQKFVKY